MNRIVETILYKGPVKKFLDYFKNLKFRWKLFWSYLAVVVLPVGILGIFSYSLASSVLINETKIWMSESVMQSAENINSRFARYNSIMEYVVYNAQILRVLNDVDSGVYQKYEDFAMTIDPVLITTINLNDEVKSMLIYTDNPTISERENTFSMLSDISAEPWYDEVINSGDLVWLKEGNEIRGYLKFYRRFKENPNSVLEMKLDADKVLDLEFSSDMDHGVLITDTSGNVVFSRESSGVEIDELTLKDLPSVMDGRSQKEIRDGIGRCLIIAQVFPESGWTMYYYSRLDPHLTGAGGILRATIIIIASCLVFLSVLTWVFSNTLVRRIHNLNNKMRLVEEGDMDLVVSSSTKDEIGELTNRFGNMLKQVNLLIDEIYKSRIIQKEAEMKALQAQINPHYLYNTLSLINWKAIQIDAMEISQIARNISKYYRTVLNNGKDIITIEDELANTRSYLEIQLVMHDNSFDVSYDIDEKILEYKMIKIILQPIVENAIEHGIERVIGRRGLIKVTAKEEGERILLAVSDNGPGMDAEKAEQIIDKESSGYGLKNVNQRLKLFFGQEGGLTVESKPNEGTTITVRIPKF